MLHTDGHDVAWSLFLRSVVRAEFRAYIAALQSNATDCGQGGIVRSI